MFRVKLNYYGSNISRIRKGLRIRGIEPEFGAAFHDMNTYYRTFLQERYRKYSKGGGNWKKLAASTIARKGHNTILIDTDRMFSLFQPQIVKTSGLLSNADKLGMTVDGGGKGYYPSGKSVSEVMGYHQAGGGRLPRRKVIVGPDDATANKIARRYEQAIRNIAKRRGGR